MSTKKNNVNQSDQNIQSFAKNGRSWFFPFTKTFVDGGLMAESQAKKLERAILSGGFRIGDESNQKEACLDLYNECWSHLPLGAFCLAVASQCIVDLDYDKVNNLEDFFNSQDVRDSLAQVGSAVAQEIELYRFVSRPGRTSEWSVADAPHGLARAHGARSWASPFDAYVFVDQAGLAMSKGRYHEALHMLEPFLSLKRMHPKVSLPLYYVFRAAVIMGIANQALGAFDRAATALRLQARIIESYGVLAQNLLVARRKLSLLHETEDFDGALRLAAKITPAFCQPFLTKTFFVILTQEHLKLRSALGDLDGLSQCLSSLRAALQGSSISESVVFPVDVQCESSLTIERSPEKVLEVIQPVLGHSIALGSYNGQVAASWHLARALMASGYFERAGVVCDSALLISRRMGFGRDHVRLLVLRALCAHVCEDPAVSRDMALEASSECVRLQLPSTACLLLMVGLWKGRFAFDALRRSQIQGALVVLEQVLASGATKRLAAWHRAKVAYRRMLHHQHPALILPGLVLEPKGRSVVQVRELAMADELRTLLALLVRAGTRGVGAEAIHRSVAISQTFHPLRHGPRVHRLIGALRQHLGDFSKDGRGGGLRPAGLGCVGRQTAEGYVYSLTHQPVLLPSCSGLSSGGAPSRGAGRTRKGSLDGQRQHEIVRILAATPSHAGLSGAALGRAFGISRQAMHKELQRLVASGKIRCVGKGRGARYVLNAKES